MSGGMRPEEMSGSRNCTTTLREWIVLVHSVLRQQRVGGGWSDGLRYSSTDT